jgi:hypothetical protein
LPWSHHRLSSCLSTGLNQWTFTVSTSAFFNKIGQLRHFAALRNLTAIGTISDSPAERPEDLWVHGP